MKIQFYKYQGAGNDFIMIDNRTTYFPIQTSVIKKLCDRHFGIGADGLILLENDENSDFRMIYFNADGHEGSLCGNGGRCTVKFAKDLNLIGDQTSFDAADGLHKAIIENSKIHLKMSDVKEIQKFSTHYFLDTGSPQHVVFVDDLSAIDVFAKGREIRYGEPYFENGTNVNFVQIDQDQLLIRTYERGVEDETLACGTGITASSIAAFESGKLNQNNITIQALGGTLEVHFKKNNLGIYEDIWLIGPAEFVFKGEIEINL